MSGGIYTRVPCPGTPEESFRSSGGGVSGGCEHPMWVWEPNLGVLQEQQCSNHCTIASALTFIFLPGRVPCCVYRGQRTTCRSQSLPFPSDPSHLLYLLLGWGGDKVSCPTQALNSSVPPASVSQTEMTGMQHQDPAGSLL